MDPHDADADAVLEFWFGTPGSPEAATQRPQWFRKDAAFDAAIAQRFGAQIEGALQGALAHWAAAPGSALAQIVVLDQFTRNAFRGTARAFAGDERALDAQGTPEARVHVEVRMPLDEAVVRIGERALRREGGRLGPAADRVQPRVLRAEETAAEHVGREPVRGERDERVALEPQEHHGVARERAPHRVHEALRAILGRQRRGHVERDRQQVVEGRVRGGHHNARWRRP